MIFSRSRNFTKIWTHFVCTSPKPSSERKGTTQWWKEPARQSNQLSFKVHALSLSRFATAPSRREPFIELPLSAIDFRVSFPLGNNFPHPWNFWGRDPKNLREQFFRPLRSDKFSFGCNEQRTAPYKKTKQPSARESCLAAHECSAVLMR